MKKHVVKFLLASACLFIVHAFSYGQFISMTIYGASGASPGNTCRYTASENIATYYYWNVTGGVFENGQTTMLKQGTWRFEAYVTWDCSSANHSVTVTAFNTWPPYVPSGGGTLSVGVSCSSPAHDCAYYQSQIDGAYQYAPAPYKCSSVMAIVEEARRAGLSCSFDTHGCR